MMSDNDFPSIILKPGREKPVLRRHPWIFSGAIEKVIGGPGCGDVVAVRSASSEILGVGSYSPQSQIRCRMWELRNDFPTKQSYLDDLLRMRIKHAYGLRKTKPHLSTTNSYRIVNAESDRIPGLVVDLYDDTLVVQLLSCGPEKFRHEIVDILVGEIGAEKIYERSDVEVRELEGLPTRKGYLTGEDHSRQHFLKEGGLTFKIDVANGQKTGFYLDQRKNRNLLRAFTPGKDVLDCFSYSGGFSVNALAGHARRVTSVDVSEQSLGLLRDNIILNKLPLENIETIQNDVFKQLRIFRDQGRVFDVIVLDPPKFAPTKKQIKSASRGYKDINLWAIKLLKPGGILFTFSCSGGISADLFQKIVAGSAEDAGEDIQIIQKMTQASDHPVLLSFPEGEYLKGLICQKM